MTDQQPGAAVPLTAEQLRMLEREMAEAQRQQKARDPAQKRHKEAIDKFLNEQLTDEERAQFRNIALNAAADGKFEVMIYSSPLRLCSDSGRAINSNSDDRPETLRGEAKALHDGYQEFAKPAGYRLKAMIINFPGGMPGDVGFFLTWEPPAD